MPPPESKDEATVLIRGEAWKISQIEDQVQWCLGQRWKRRKWTASSSVVYKDGKKVGLREGGWDHDHCEICWWKLFDSENTEEGEAYCDEGISWLCIECYDQFILDDALNLHSKSEQVGADQPATAPESKLEGKEKPKPESEAGPQ